MRKLILVSALLAALAVAPAAHSTIVVQRSIAGVALGVSENDVIATLGQPPKIRKYTVPEIGLKERILDYGLTEVYVSDDFVNLITTTSKTESTTNGARVGISEKALKQKVKGLKCETFRGSRSCSRGQFLAGKKVTTFFFKRKKVARISMGYVID